MCIRDRSYATAGTAAFLNAHGVETTPVYWPDEKPGAENNVLKMIADHKFDLIVNIPKNHSKRCLLYTSNRPVEADSERLMSNANNR